MKNNVSKMREYLEKRKAKTFTTYEIQAVTNTTCPHDVVRDLKRFYKISDTWLMSCKNITDSEGNVAKVYKRYKLFTIEGLA